VLALPAAVATMGDVSDALVPASLLLGFLGILSAYSFYSIGRTCSEENVSSLEEAWEKIIGKDSSWMVTLSCFIIPLSAALIYSIVLGDFLSTLVRASGLQGLLAIRQTSILAVTLAALYPLCLLKSLAALAPMSIVGVLSVLLTALFMSIRALDGTYAAGGKYLLTLNDNLRPSFGTKGLKVFTPSTLVLTSMVSSAFLCHFCAPDFYHNLRVNTLPSFKTLTILGFSATALINTLMMCMGFLTFGGGSSGMVLNNYSPIDIGATLCRLLMCINLIGSYPFVFGAMKSSFISMTQLKGM
jgi:amino acid permease